MALGVDPSITLLHETGETALAILLITLIIKSILEWRYSGELALARR